MTAIFNFHSFLPMVCLLICMCSYIRYFWPQMIDSSMNHGFKGMVRKAAVIGDRLSPWVSAACVFFAGFNILVRWMIDNQNFHIIICNSFHAIICPKTVVMLDLLLFLQFECLTLIDINFLLFLINEPIEFLLIIMIIFELHVHKVF